MSNLSRKGLGSDRGHLDSKIDYNVTAFGALSCCFGTDLWGIHTWSRGLPNCLTTRRKDLQL